MTKIAITPHSLSPLSGEPGALELAGLLGGDASCEDVIAAYHERTKHHYHRYAASQGYMDWATQPDPFRRYAGADLVRLLLPKAGRPLPHWQLYARETVSPAPLSLQSVSLFLLYALSMTACMQVGETRWPLRAYPPSGSLHLTEDKFYTCLFAQSGHDLRAFIRSGKSDALIAAAIGLSGINLKNIIWKFSKKKLCGRRKSKCLVSAADHFMRSKSEFCN